MASVPSRPSWTQEAFFAWAQAQDGRYEFDGVQPVAMTADTVAHDFVSHNLYRAVERTLPEGSPCRVLGPNIGVATMGAAVRFPDAVISCAHQALGSRLVVSALAVFEVISDSTAGTDRITKVREYAAVASVLRYVLIESTLAGLTVLSRTTADESWTASALALEDALQLPELGLDIPVAELYRGLTFPPDTELAET